MTKLIGTASTITADWLLSKTRGRPGISGLSDPKFYLCAACYIGAFLLFANDSFFLSSGVFQYNQGIVTMLAAFLICASLDWELCLFGRPAGANLLLHISQIPAVTLLLARVLATKTVPPPPESWLGKATALVKSGLDIVGKDLFTHIPAWLTDIFSNGKISLFLILLLFILCWRNLSLKIGALAIAILIPFATALQEGHCLHLLAGLLPLAIGLALQFCRYDRIVYYENIITILNRSHASVDSLLLAVIGRTMTQLQERDAISVATFQGIIKATYLHSSGADNANPALIEHYAREALQRMIDDGLVVLESDSSNSRITPANALFRVPNNLLANVASFPRILFLLIVAVLWILSPFDLLPDSLPLVGMLDDVSVTILSGFALKNAVES